MPHRIIINTAILIFFLGAIAFSYMYGPYKRSYATPHKTISVHSAKELDNIWRSSSVHGRIAIIFARHLNPQFSINGFPETDYIDTAMRHGIIRAAYYVVPDAIWSDVISENLLKNSSMAPLKTTNSGFIILHEGGRINVMPLSKFIPELNENVLVVIEEKIWSSQERLKIDNYFRSGLLTSDLVVRIE